MKRWVLVVALAAAAAVAGCGDDDEGGSDGADDQGTTSAPTLPVGDAVIETFEVPESVDCAPDTPNTTVTVTYAVTGAASQELIVDGFASPLEAASGSIDAPVHCDAIPHTFVLAATDAAGGVTTDQRTVETVIP